MSNIKEEYPSEEGYHPFSENEYQKQRIKQEPAFDLQFPGNQPMLYNDTVTTELNITDLNQCNFETNGRLENKDTKYCAKKRFVWPDFPYTQDELMEMPLGTFNAVISVLNNLCKHQAKYMRRKGKNKVATRNCRKRKIDIMESLSASVESLEEKKCRLLEINEKTTEETNEIRKYTDWLIEYIFENIRDANGDLYSKDEYRLKYTSDRNVYLLPTGIKPRRKYKFVTKKV